MIIKVRKPLWHSFKDHKGRSCLLFVCIKHGNVKWTMIGSTGIVDYIS
jgi:hypothetical protein